MHQEAVFNQPHNEFNSISLTPGKLLLDALGSDHDYLDPGALALLGAVSFFGGVTRLTLSLTVIMVEMTNDIQFLLLIMVTVLVAKWAGDFLTHPIYHALLEVKCIPFLEQDPRVRDPQGHQLDLELYTAGQVMAGDPVTLEVMPKVGEVAKVLLEVGHGGFPVVTAEGHYAGFISRSELVMILLNFKDEAASEDEAFRLKVTFPALSDLMERKIVMPEVIQGQLRSLTSISKRIDLEEFVNTSGATVEETFSLQRTYTVFQSQGLRHLTVVDRENRVRGVITRKDLMGFALEDKLIPIAKETLGGKRLNL